MVGFIYIESTHLFQLCITGDINGCNAEFRYDEMLSNPNLINKLCYHINCVTDYLTIP